jgi:hypothetical protein
MAISLHSCTLTSMCPHTGKEGGEPSAEGTGVEAASDGGLEAMAEAAGGGGVDEDDTHSLQDFIVNDEKKALKSGAAARAGRAPQGPPR